MRKTFLVILSFLCVNLVVNAQNYTEEILHISTEKDSIYGTLLTPLNIEKPKLVILIVGSGPTDRDGNQATLKNNSLKYLAEGLTDKGIATYRYDKPYLSLVNKKGFKEEDLRFSELIDYAKRVGAFFKKQDKYSQIILAGHSQGSLVGMIASKDIADAYISLAGPAKSIDLILREQLLKQLPQLETNLDSILTSLRKGEKPTDMNPMLATLFRPSVQPFLTDWMQYNPKEYIKALEIPLLIINGTKDLQVTDKEAQLLHEAQPNSKLVILENMNHVFKEIKGETLENQMSYMNPDLPVLPELIATISEFVKNLK